MKVSNVAFNGRYIEAPSPKFVNQEVKDELEIARPYLKIIAYSMPTHDLFVHIDDTPCDSELVVDCINYKTKKSHNLANKNEHSLIGNGFWIIADVFKGMEKYDKKLFTKTATNFVKRFDQINDKLLFNFNEITECGCSKD